MLTKVEIFETGLQTKDGKGIMPGSTLYIKGNVPAGWKRVAREAGLVAPQKLVVASPAPAAEAPTQTHDRDELIKDYTELFGSKPHHKMSTENIHKAIVDKLGDE